jgi:hypothetical protein
MSTSVYSLSLARTPDLLWSLTPNSELAAFQFPPMAFPASMSPSEAQDYAASMLPLAHVPAPAELAWHHTGHTNTAEGRQPAYRASWTVSIQSLSPAL